MTIKEIESLCGMTRANIRFYEAEGLLTPERSQNGYRDYSEKDAEVLKRIKLLRTLHISLEEIKALHMGEHELAEVLERQVALLEDQKEDIVKSQEICQVMRRDGVCYGTLNAQRYLDAMEKSPEYTAPELEADAIPRESAPWRRFWARHLDMVLYSTIWSVFLVCVCNVNLSNRGTAGDLIDAIMCIVLMLLVEPALIALCTTTPGKWIMGLRVTDHEDRRLTYSEACSRTFMVLWKGMGLQIPIYGLYRNFRCYQACQEGETLEWEYETCITLHDKKNWRIGALLAAYGAIFAGLFFVMASAQLPKHRGQITVAQFCENYNRLAGYYGVDDRWYLNQQGQWVDKWKNRATVYIGGDEERPELIFTQKDGFMTGVHFTKQMQDSDNWPPSYQNQMILMAMSYVCAQKECNVLSKEWKDMIRVIEEKTFEDYDFSYYGVDVKCKVEYSGYMDVSPTLGVLYPIEGEKNRFELQFMMGKNQF